MTKTPERDPPADGKTDAAAVPKAASRAAGMKRIADYAVRGAAPALAVIALVVSIVSIVDSRSSRTPLASTAARIDSLNASLAASQAQVERLTAALVQLQAIQQDEHRKRDSQITEIVQSVSKLQTRMKIFPTLDEILYIPPPAAAVPASGAAAVPASAGMPADQLQAIQEALKKLNKK